MNLIDLIKTTMYVLGFGLAAYGFGFTCLNWLKIKHARIIQTGLSLMIGLSLIANVGLVFLLLNRFSVINLGLLLIIGISLSLYDLSREIPELFKRQISYLTVIKSDLFASFALTATVLMQIAIYLGSMAPPIATDELHYHFPQARSMALLGKLPWSGNPPDFFTSIPKLMEVVFAIGLKISNFSLAHGLNYLIMLSFVILVFGIIQRRYGYRSAVFAVLLLTLFEDFTWNATVGFIDSATSAYEIGALLLTLNWLDKKKLKDMIPIGLLIGTSMGMKYSPIPTALFITVIILSCDFDFKNWLKRGLLIGIPALVMGGYWYLKNLIGFGNPFYPLYFGHPGISEASYVELMGAIQQWEPKTWPVFFHKIGRYLTYSGSTVYLSIYFAILPIFKKPRDKWIILLTGYYLGYVVYWFFFATHQVRFLLSGLIAASILTAIFLARVNRQLLYLGIAVIVVVSLFVRPYPERNLLSHYLYMKLHVVERQYALGNISEEDFLTREFGCQYKIVSYLNRIKNTENVIDNWTRWFGPSTSYFADQYKMIIYTYGPVKDKSSLIDDLKQKRIGYIYINNQHKAANLVDTNIFVKERTSESLPAEELLLKQSDKVLQIDQCNLYKINLSAE